MEQGPDFSRAAIASSPPMTASARRARWRYALHVSLAILVALFLFVIPWPR